MSVLKTGVNDLETWCKQNGKTQLLDEWDYVNNGSLTPQNITHASTKKVWWRCKTNHRHTWQTPLYSRTLHNRSCPFCKGFALSTTVVGGLNDLETWCRQSQKADLLNLWDYEKNDGLTPADVSYLSSNKIHWKCLAGHSFSRSVKDMTSKFKSTSELFCPACHTFENWCLTHSHEHLLKEWSSENTFSPADVPFLSKRVVHWVCNKGHKWDSSLSSRFHKRSTYSDYTVSGCPVCTHKAVCKGDTDFETWCHENGRTILLQEWSPENEIKPSELLPYSAKRVKWVCHNNPTHKWETALSSRTHVSTNCPKCKKRDRPCKQK